MKVIRGQSLSATIDRVSTDKARFAPNRRLLAMSLTAACFLLGSALVAAQSAQGGQAPNGSTPSSDPGPNRAWTASGKIAISEPGAGPQDPAAANAARKKQLADDSAELVKLATDLKAEVDKTNKDTLSLGVIRKAEEIEKLAHAVKEKMKLTAQAR